MTPDGDLLWGFMAGELTRYWIEFERTAELQFPVGVSLGVGVTGRGRDDALGIVRERVFEGDELPAIAGLAEDVDISTLDERHVLPNMEPPNERGIWFPRGYV
jgi:hypothetical protein